MLLELESFSRFLYILKLRWIVFKTGLIALSKGDKLKINYINCYVNEHVTILLYTLKLTILASSLPVFFQANFAFRSLCKKPCLTRPTKRNWFRARLSSLSQRLSTLLEQLRNRLGEYLQFALLNIRNLKSSSTIHFHLTYFQRLGNVKTVVTQLHALSPEPPL